MVIIIDGYNFLRSVFDRHKGRLEDERALLIKKLGAYFDIKKASVREILLVFDGGRSPHSEREVKKRVIVYFSGTRSSADEVIVEQVKKRASEDILLITHDRALIEQVVAVNKKTVTMQADLFWLLIHQAVMGEKNNSLEQVHHGVKKFEQEESDLFPASSDELDALMESVALTHREVAKDEAELERKKEAKNKKSKEEKALEKVMKKI